MDLSLIAVAAVAAVASGTLCLAGGARSFVGNRRWRALVLLIIGTLAAGAGAILGVLALSFNAYRHLSAETHLVELAIEQQAPQRFTVRLISRDEPSRSFTIAGDEWLIEARILKWRPWATALGFPALIRLERLGGRYVDIEHEIARERTVHSLIVEKSPDVWQWATQAPTWLPGLDTVYGTGTYLPLAHGARYTVLVTPSGLMARAANSRAEQAVLLWRRTNGSPAATF